MTTPDWIEVLVAILGLTGALLGFIGTWVARTLEKLHDSIGVAVKSIQDLNLNVAVVVEKVNSHEKRIERLETRDNE